jgi:hypothetical protein
MKIGMFDPRNWPRMAAVEPRPAGEKTITDTPPGPGDDEVTISATARELAAQTGPGGPETTERADRRLNADMYDRPEIRSAIARRIADEMLKASSARKEDD